MGGVFCLVGFLPLDRILLLAHPLPTQQIQSKEVSLLYKKQRAWLENIKTKFTRMFMSLKKHTLFMNTDKKLNTSE